MDIYAFALVIWEICRRIESLGDGIHAQPYEVPYQEYVPREPSMEEMRQCVSIGGRRPTMPNGWGMKSKMMGELARIMNESWTASPNSRLTALNIRCSLDRVCEEQKLNIIT